MGAPVVSYHKTLQTTVTMTLVFESADHRLAAPAAWQQPLTA